MVAGGLPAPQVYLDDGTGTFPYNITSRGRYVEGITGGRGRQDELAQTAPGQITLVLDNDDGALTLGSTILGSPSPVIVDQKVRITYTVGATTVNRYTGNLIAAPVSWPGGGSEYALVKATLMDPGAIATRWPLRSYLEQEILEESPEAYYTLGDPQGSLIAVDSSGNQAPAMTMTGSGAPVVFGGGIGPGTDGLTSATFANGQYLTGIPVAGPSGFELWFSTTVSGTPQALLNTLGANPGQPDLRIDSSGHLFAGSVTSPGVVNDGLVHQVAVIQTSAFVAAVYLDGVALGTTSLNLSAITTGWNLGAMPSAAVGFAGSISHLAVFFTAPSAARIAAHYAAGSTGFDNEPGTTRLTRLAGYANLPVGSMDSSLTGIAFSDCSGQQLADVINDVAAAEYGIAYFDGSGQLVFHNRNRGPLKTSPDITVDANFLDEGTEFQVDMQGACNYFETTAQGTGIKQVTRDLVSEQGDGTAVHPAHGRYPLSQTWLVKTDAEALDRANWIVSTRSQPVQRAGQLKVDLLTMTQADQQAWLAVEPDHWIQITGLPSQTPGGTTANVVVEGWSEVMNATEWSLTLNVVTRAFFTAWILGDSTYSVLGSTTRLFI